MSSAMMMSASNDSRVPPRPSAVIVAPLISGCVRVPTVNSDFDQPYPSSFPGLNERPGPKYSFANSSFDARNRATAPTDRNATRSFPPPPTESECSGTAHSATHTHVNQQLRLPMPGRGQDDLPATSHQRPQNRLHPPLLKRRRQVRATPRSPKPPPTKRQKMLQQRRNMLHRQIPMRLRERTLNPQPVPSRLNLPLIPNRRIPARNRRRINPKPLSTLPRRT